MAGKSNERETVVRLLDLQLLIERFMEKDIRERAQTLVLNQPGNSNPEAALIFSEQIEQAIPEATKNVEIRYRHLREALESGNDVAPALAAFLGREYLNS